MANPHPPQSDPDDLWPSCDKQPPGVSIRPLGHGDFQALLAHLHHAQDDEDEGLVVGPAGRRPAAGGPGGGGAGPGQRRPARRLHPR